MILFGNQGYMINFDQKIGIMKKTVFYLFLMVATFSLSSFGIADNPKATMTIQNSSRTPSVAPKSNLSATVSLLPETGVVDKAKESEKTKGLLAQFFSFVFSSVTKLIFGLISK